MSRRSRGARVALPVLLTLSAAWAVAPVDAGAQSAAASAAPARAAAPSGAAPVFEVDPTWPKALPQGWNWDHGPDSPGSDVLGIRSDHYDHIWVTNRGSIAEYDAEGNLLQAWNASRPLNRDRQYGAIHGMFVDRHGFVWTTGRENHVVMKFTRDGKLAMVIGTYDVNNGSNDKQSMGRPADIWYDDVTHELFVADGYTNRRVVVYDGLTGAYLRHWGADGKPPVDGPRDSIPTVQLNVPHGIVGSRDGLIYVADRTNSRVQVFDHMGTFKGQGVTREGNGGAFSVALSPDPQQRWVYVTDGTGHRIWILRRSDMQVVGSFSEEGFGPGQVGRPHNITVDSKGNIYVAEASPGQRAQKFVLKSEPPQ